jgi:pimeloyl-ACP methyl ester carboxylesterase
MRGPAHLLYIHGSDSSSQTYKAQVLRRLYPHLIVPDFSGPLGVRMAALEAVVGEGKGWILIGSSLGGLMAALFAARHPDQVRKLILLAPALHLPEFARRLRKPVDVPAVLIQGKKDEVVPPQAVHRLAKRLFPKLHCISVDDDHRLHKAADTLDWKALIERR